MNLHVDELSMMTYLSQFPDRQLKDGAHLCIKTRDDPGKVKDERTDGCLHKDWVFHWPNQPVWR